MLVIIYNFIWIKILIVNNPHCGAIKRAEKLGIPFTDINHNEFQSREEVDQEIIKVLNTYDVEGIVMAGWMRIVTEKLIKSYDKRIINIHPSLLPSFPGIRAVEQAIDAGVLITGCSVHLVESKVDSGPLLIQAAIPVKAHDDIKTLSKRIQDKEHLILPIGVAIAAKRWRDSE